MQQSRTNHAGAIDKPPKRAARQPMATHPPVSIMNQLLIISNPCRAVHRGPLSLDPTLQSPARSRPHFAHSRPLSASSRPLQQTKQSRPTLEPAAARSCDPIRPSSPPALCFYFFPSSGSSSSSSARPRSLLAGCAKLEPSSQTRRLIRPSPVRPRPKTDTSLLGCHRLDDWKYGEGFRGCSGTKFWLKLTRGCRCPGEGQRGTVAAAVLDPCPSVLGP